MHAIVFLLACVGYGQHLQIPNKALQRILQPREQVTVISKRHLLKRLAALLLSDDAPAAFSFRGPEPSFSRLLLQRSPKDHLHAMASHTPRSRVQRHPNPPQAAMPPLGDDERSEEALTKEDAKKLLRKLQSVLESGYAEDETDHDFDEGDGYDEDDEDYEKMEDVFDSVVRVYCTHSEADHELPWQRVNQYSSSSSGFVVSIPGSGRLIMTNAHSVEYGIIIQVRRRGMATKHAATVEVVAHDCDLALLRVEGEGSEEFWEDLEPMEFGELPLLQDQVSVLGYPLGGETMSVTEGVVSRIEMQEYAQSGTYLLAVQIDAAINSGNSGGPVVNEDLQVVGVAFQSIDAGEAESVGYAVPVDVVRHFLEQIRRNGRFTGFCTLGIRIQSLENPATRHCFGMSADQSGILVLGVAPIAKSSSFLQANDVILAADGINISNDGTIPFQATGERVMLNYYLSLFFLGDSVRLDILRNKEVMTLDVPLSIPQPLVPFRIDSWTPPYMILAGMVFTVFSMPYLEDIDKADITSVEVRHLMSVCTHGRRLSSSEDVVVLVQVLAHSSNVGFNEFQHLQLSTLNDIEVHSLKHLADLVEANTEPFLRFNFKPGNEVVVIEAATVAQVTAEICSQNSIPAPISDGLKAAAKIDGGA